MEGNLDCLRYAYENGCEWDSLITSIAAKFGQFECLKFAHEHGCPWDLYTTLRAAEGGSDIDITIAALTICIFVNSYLFIVAYLLML